ncbi:isoamylase early set domain-containing protein [Streptacidiphilus fuscans]|uniref:Isoamylase early set domain-containing protein n=1 Tax=Streptacidiphilus fuscans TaxID=2789292 RepID=A0A931BAB6_9ACTN|nr:isoamylase early set domain-containing protein [Streptacidiphilus fuscans]MBF9069780.1 isoamylase early set domain-containing protein [Streptacidiphilus fuscans]
MLTRTRLFGGRTRVTFRLDAAAPDGIVSVVGDFNGWQPGVAELVPRRDGTRTVSVSFPPGEHRFRYLATGGVWFDDDHADRIDPQGSLIRLE